MFVQQQKELSGQAMHYLFCVGLDLLGGATLRLVASADLDPVLPVLVLFRLVEKEESEESSSSLLDSIRGVGRRADS